MPLTREKLRPRECKAKLAKSSATQLRKGSRELENQFEYIKELNFELINLNKLNEIGSNSSNSGSSGRDRETKIILKELKEGKIEVSD